MGVCPICFDGLKSPVCCVPCGHVFCNVCIHRWRTTTPRSMGNILLNYHENRSCPQCRSEIHALQRVRFDDQDVQESEEAEENPWEATDDYTTILKSAYSIWSRSELRKACVTAQSKIFSISWVQRSWDIGKTCVTNLGNIVSEFRHVEGGPEVQIEWLKNRAKQGYITLQNKIVSHPKVESLRTQWSNFSEEKKRAVMLLIAVICVLTLADAQSPEGFLQSVILPVFEAAFAVMFEIMSMLSYCLTRPLVCSFHCLMSIILMILDIVVAILRTPIAIFEILLWLPYTMIMGVTLFLSNTVGTLMRTVFPLALVLYVFFPGVQQRVREIFADLQQN
ncbi:uncharacterized protein LOC133204564 [Saccostrea echinata]|uniref:uncharacterized protein LOC133204564 n=1 Tax=Saccostrea echinata TaxID=191078 RepID=UPI002A82CAD6|nr:uncharacterized protein LOC133204564 [Saccostrea echinata]XP_061196297.1 uncharacterized protein LOC133204564 [Saccostrea echinata]